MPDWEPWTFPASVVARAAPTARWRTVPELGDGGEYVAGRTYRLVADGASVAWDADGDGAYDDGLGTVLLHTFRLGEQTIGVRVADAHGGVSIDRRTITAGTRTSGGSFLYDGKILSDYSKDPNGDPLQVEWDLDGDHDFDDATGPRARPLPGYDLVGIKVTDPSGEIGVDYEAIGEWPWCPDKVPGGAWASGGSARPRRAWSRRRPSGRRRRRAA